MAKKLRGIYERIPGSQIWWVQWFDGAGNRHREKAGTKAAAIKLQAKRTTDRLEARKIPETLRVRAKDALLSELMEDATENAKHENGVSAQKNLGHITKALTEAGFGKRVASSITTEELLGWLRKRAKERKWEDGTYNHYVTQLKVIYGRAVEKGKVSANPAKALKRYELDNDKPRYLSDEEESRMEEAFIQWPEHRPAYIFARKTGLRAGAQFALKWSQIDLTQRTLTLPRKKKTKYRKEHVLPLNPAAYKVILDLKEQSKGSPFVFAEYQGDPHSTRPTDWFTRIVTAAQVEDFTWHSLRHDFASQLVMRGVDLKTVQTLMCHANIKQTARYAHLSPNHLRVSADMLDTPITTTTEKEPAYV